MGLLTAAIGVFLMAAMAGAFGRPAPSSGPSDPNWLGWLIGYTFFAGGASVIIKSIWAGDALQQSDLPAEVPLVVRIFYHGLGLSIVLSLAVAFTWVGFGPGERHFSGSGAFLGPWVGRAMFGLFASLVWLTLIVLGFRKVKRLLRKRQPDFPSYPSANASS